MGINPKWLAELSTEDEYGEPEKWEFHFKRATAGAMLAFVKANAAGNDSDKVEFVMEAIHGIIASVTRNGEESSIDAMPFELHLEVLPLHPTFRSTEDAGPPALTK